MYATGIFHASCIRGIKYLPGFMAKAMTTMKTMKMEAMKESAMKKARKNYEAAMIDKTDHEYEDKM